MRHQSDQPTRRSARLQPARFALSLLTVSVALVAAKLEAAELGPGDRAPAFALAGSDGSTHRLAELLEPGGVVVAWFPKAFTPG